MEVLQHPYTSQIAEEASSFFCFLVTLFRVLFYATNLVMLNLAVLKKTDKSQKHTRGGVSQTFIPTI